MRRDLIIGVLVSLLIHGGAAWLSEAFKSNPKKTAPKDDTPTVQLMEMPKIEPDEPEKTESTDEPQQPIEFAPPMQADVPQIVQLDSFVQQVQPPPPEGLKPNVGAITIPAGRPGGFASNVEIFDPSKLDQQAQPRVRTRPVYPFEMQRAGINGEVLVQFIIDANGDVHDPFVIRSSQREFESSALQAVSKWKFKPGRKGGRAVASRAQQVLTFKLSDD
jgi:periplasmic protein TonB